MENYSADNRWTIKNAELLRLRFYSGQSQQNAHIRTIFPAFNQTKIFNNKAVSLRVFLKHTADRKSKSLGELFE